MKKNYIFLVIALYFLAFFDCFSSTPQQRVTQRPKGTTSLSYGFLQYLPSNYATVAKHPLVIFLHGIGERGNGTTLLYKLEGHGPFKLIKEGKDFPFICIGAQETSGLWEDSIGIRSIIRWAIANYKVDPARVYVIGHSSGGWGAWRGGAIVPSLVGAVVPISGCGNIKEASKFKTVPAWAFHNRGDRPQCAKDMVNAINAAGGNAKITIYPVDYKHDAWTVTYSDNNMWAWMLAQKRTTWTALNKYPTASAGADKTVVLPTRTTSFTATASDVDGTIASYKWTKVSGPTYGTLSGTTTRYLSVSNLVQGTYVFRVAVKDNSGQTTLDDVKLTVIRGSTNTLPVVSAGADKVVTLPTNKLTLYGSAYDPDGTISYTLWTKVSGPTVTMTNSTQTTVYLSNLVAGYYTFRLTVKDNSGASKYDDVKVTVRSSTARLALPEEQETIEIYPTLVREKLFLDLKTLKVENAKVLFISSKGVKVKEMVIRSESGHPTEINLTELPPDVYFIKIYGENQQKTLRFIKAL